jgi:hypothetical protein
MVKKRKVWIPPKEFVVISDYGYFAGLHKGGKFRWSFDLRDAKPLTNVEQYDTIKRGCFGTEVILDFIN